ncbi:MAG: hypothetical protein V7L26_25560 [Nostoc sp.]|uniref:hypothetical protein n=1 Tax=Nostoc sp. TaxID=1180 RepID=UPI002FF92DD4
MKEEIHSIITNYGGNITGSFIVGGYNVQVLSSGISTNTKTIPQTSFRTESTVISCKIGEIKQLTPTQNSPRPLGIWKGKVEISEDFNQTSSDIISEFGIE